MTYNLLRSQETGVDLSQAESDDGEIEDALPMKSLRKIKRSRSSDISNLTQGRGRVYSKLLTEDNYEDQCGSTENLIAKCGIVADTPVDQENGLGCSTGISDKKCIVIENRLLSQKVQEKTLSHNKQPLLVPIAPPLNDSISHHIVFIAHPKDHNWVSDVINRLETPALGFRCWFQDKENAPSLNGSQMRTNTNGVKKSLKTIVVLSKDFMNEIWLNPSSHPFSGQELFHLRLDIVLMLLDDCDIPPPLVNFVCIDVRQSSWWSRLIGQLCSFDDIKQVSDEKRLSTYSNSTISAANGYLILSIKSRCIYCGQEMIDTSDVPQEFVMNGIQISQEEYRCALHHLMKDSKFRCHVWCYNVPAAIVFFSLFLGVCLTAIPLLESKYVLKGKENGLEFVHGGVVWLCVLTGYMLVMHISKKKMKLSTYHRLRYVNAILSKHNLLAGVENLGMADCNKYYLHFFYFDVGPCLLYLQELFAALDEPPSTTHTADSTNPELAIDIDCDTHNTSDSNGLGTTLTNATMQNRAEELVLQNSGEYLSHLITKKLDKPHRQRHIKNYPCLCQYVEEKAYKIAS